MSGQQTCRLRVLGKGLRGSHGFQAWLDLAGPQFVIHGVVWALLKDLSIW